METPSFTSGGGLGLGRIATASWLEGIARQRRRRLPPPTTRRTQAGAARRRLASASRRCPSVAATTMLSNKPERYTSGERPIMLTTRGAGRPTRAVKPRVACPEDVPLVDERAQRSCHHMVKRLGHVCFEEKVFENCVVIVLLTAHRFHAAFLILSGAPRPPSRRELTCSAATSGWSLCKTAGLHIPLEDAQVACGCCVAQGHGAEEAHGGRYHAGGQCTDVPLLQLPLDVVCEVFQLWLQREHPHAPGAYVAHLVERHDGRHLALLPEHLAVFHPPAKCPCVGRRQGDDQRTKLIGENHVNHPQDERQIVDRGPACTSAAESCVGVPRSPRRSRLVNGASGGGGASCVSPR